MNTDHFKKRLLEEKNILECELNKLGMRVAGGWEATEAPKSELGEDTGENKAEETEMADQIEDFEERTAEERTLEIRHREVLRALESMSKGNYGMCETGGAPHPIEKGRLEANPAAHSCMQHMPTQ